MKRGKLWLGIWAMVFIGLLAFGGQTSWGEMPTTLKKIVVAEAARAEGWLPIYLANELGYYKEEGLDLKFVTYKDGPVALMGLLAGEAQFCVIGFEPVLQAFEKGKETKVILTTTYNQPYMFATRKGINKIADLKGKVIFSGMAGSAPYYFAKAVLRNGGLNPDKDVTFANLEYGAEIAALERGHIHGCFVRSTRATEFLAIGANIVADATDPVQHTRIYGSDRYEAYVVQVTNDSIKNNPKDIQAFANAVYKAMVWQAGHTDEEVAKKVGPFFPGRNIDAKLISVLRRSLSPDGGFTEKGYDTVLRFCRNAGIVTKPISFDSVIDRTFMEKAKKGNR